jgi:hypothetical protein
MASVFKTFLNNDIISTRTLLHEVIPLTGSIASGSYGTFGSETNIKEYSHGLFQSVYDYPHLSSSANHVYDITVGIASNSALSASTPITQQIKKMDIYNQMAQVLMGYDHTGSILKFDQDGDILAGGTKFSECVFLNFARLLVKDEIKKGSVTINLGTQRSSSVANNFRVTITDNGAQNNFRTNSPAGEYGILSMSSGEAVGSNLNAGVGLVFYQAGVVVLTASVFQGAPTGAISASALMNVRNGGHEYIDGALTGSNIDEIADAIRERIYNITFNNTTELNSTIHFVRVNHNDFNYSANPTYLDGSKIRVKNNTLDEPVTYITTVGLYSADNELLAVAKLSEPLKKTPSNEITLRVRIDF